MYIVYIVKTQNKKEPLVFNFVLKYNTSVGFALIIENIQSYEILIIIHIQNNNNKYIAYLVQMP